MTESQWRFLKAIADRLPQDRIVELRLFPTIRQGGAESGVAVVAVEDMAEHGSTVSPGDSSEATEFDPDATLELEVPQRREAPTLSLDYAQPGGSSDLTDRESPHVVADLADLAGVRGLSDMVTEEIAVPPLVLAGGRAGLAAEQEVELAVELDNGDVQEFEGEPTRSLDDLLDLAIQSEAIAPAAGRTSPKRYAVLAARYRLTLKGPDRGKWDFEITHEADAPLDTVERVARGVARRAGDAGEPESFTAPQLRSALAQPWWNSAT